MRFWLQALPNISPVIEKVIGKSMSTGAVEIISFEHIAAEQSVAVREAVDDIFFTSSGVAAFAHSRERDQFHHTWLGQYLTLCPDTFFVAMNDGDVVGYLAGSLLPPGREYGFTGQHHVSVFRDLWREFPAHLHINVDENQRSVGVGRRLVKVFLDACRGARRQGVHVVTGDGHRNNRFYRQCGFTEEECRDVLERRLRFMGARIGHF